MDWNDTLKFDVPLCNNCSLKIKSTYDYVLVQIIIWSLSIYHSWNISMIFKNVLIINNMTISYNIIKKCINNNNNW